MEFISADEFLKQHKEIQEVFIEWWKPSIGDLATNRHSDLSVLKENRDIEAVKIYKGQPYAIPLFTECQLRKFIEDKVEQIQRIEFYYTHYDIILQTGRVYITKEINLLQAYWKVALEIAKENI